MSIRIERTGYEIAVIGLAGVFPGAATLEKFWQNLLDGVCAIDEFDRETLAAAGVDDSYLDNPNFVKSKGVFPDLAFFDADFFAYTPGDVALLDPQVRQLHQGVYHALEDAGYGDTQKRRNIGLFAGASGNFTWELDSFLQATHSSAGQFAALQLNDKDFLATRIAYKLNLRGPAVALHTACSTGLLAVDLASRYLLTGACNVAVAAGVGLTLPAKNGYAYEEGMIKSADGRCRAFADDANGTVEGNGMGVVVLKPLEIAEEDGDSIYAIINATSTNNDGERKVGFTAPSIEGQAEVIRRALFMAEVEPESISYIESHGTGTNLGDPVEIAALTQAFNSDQKQFCGIGSVKSSIGHLDTAAGIASLIKVVLALQAKTIPASINVTEVNRNINFADSPFFLVREVTQWQRPECGDGSGDVYPRRAAVSSFGIGGTNVHLIIEEAPEPQTSSPAHAVQGFTLTALNDNALRRQAAALDAWLAENPETNPADLAFSHQVGRGNLAQRLAFGYQSIESLRTQLQAVSQAPSIKSIQAMQDAQAIWLFPGQGSQYPRMAQQLYNMVPEFANELEQCLVICDNLSSTSIRELLLSPTEVTEQDRLSIQETENTQLCLFVVEYSLAKWLMSLGLTPKAMIGHSLGEFVAATIAGVFSLGDAITAVQQRGRLMQSMDSGVMIAVLAESTKVASLIAEVKAKLPNEVLDIAANNGPTQSVAAGSDSAITALEEACKHAQITAKRLRTSHAFHSALMEPMLSDFEQCLATFTLNEPSMPYLSNVTGTWITAEQATDRNYYLQHIRQAVLFYPSVSELAADTSSVFVEVGPGNTLSQFAKQANPQARSVQLLPREKDEVNAAEFCYAGINSLSAHGIDIDWKAYYADQQRIRLRLPSYPFERSEFSTGRGDTVTVLKTLFDQESQLTQEDNDLEGVTEQPRNAEVASEIGAKTFAWQPARCPVAPKTDAVLGCLNLQTTAKDKANIVPIIGGLRVTNVLHSDQFGRQDTKHLHCHLDNPVSIRQLLQHANNQHEPFQLILLSDTITQTSDLTALMLRVSQWCRVLQEDANQQVVQFTLLLREQHPLTEAQVQQLSDWLQIVRSSARHIDLRVFLLPETQKDDERIALATRIEHQLFDQSPHAHLLRFTQRNQLSYTLTAAQQFAGTYPLTHQHITVLVPEGHSTSVLRETLASTTNAHVSAVQLSHKPDTALRSHPVNIEDVAATMRAAQASQQGQASPALNPDLNTLMDQLGSALVCEFIHSHIALDLGATISSTQLINTFGITQPLHGYADFLLSVLMEEGYVQPKEDNSFEVTKPLSEHEAPAIVLEKLTQLASNVGADSTIATANTLVSVFAELHSILANEYSFDEFVANNEVTTLNAFTAQTGYVREQLKALIQPLNQGAQPLRILEISDAFQSTVQHAKAALANNTDVSLYFASTARQGASATRHYLMEQQLTDIQFGHIDIDLPLESQGLADQYFDVIYVSNSLHLATNLAECIKHLQAHLTENGVLCIFTQTQQLRATTLLNSLAPTWWQFATEERQTTPLLTATQWAEHLASHGLTVSDTLANVQHAAVAGFDFVLAQNHVASGALQENGSNAATHATVEYDLHSPTDLTLILDVQLASDEGNFTSLNGGYSTRLTTYDSYYSQVQQWLNSHQNKFANHPHKAVLLSNGLLVDSMKQEVKRWHSQQQMLAAFAPHRIQLPFIANGTSTTPLDSAVNQALQAINSDWQHVIVHAEQLPRVFQAQVSRQQKRLSNQASNNEAVESDTQNKYEQMVSESVSELLGIKDLGIHDDFFDLGGDSLKVAQLTTELGKQNIEIMPNDVYNFPTVSSLANYIRQKLGNVETIIDSFEDVATLLSEALDTQVIGKQLDVDGTTMNVLGVHTTSSLTAESIPPLTVATLLAKKIDKQWHPAEILPLTCDTDTIESLISSKPTLPEPVLNARIGLTHQRNLLLGKHITAAEIELSYPISQFQKMYLKNDNRIMLFQIDFDELLDDGLLSQALTEVINSQGLLRSSLQRKAMGRFNWQQHEKVDYISIPSLDLTDVAREQHKAVTDALMAAEYETDFDEEAGLLFHVTLIRYQYNRYTLLFNLDHSIFDNISGQVLRRQLTERYQALREGSKAPLQYIKPYQSYLEQLAYGPQGIAPEKLIELFEFKTFGERRNDIEKYIVKHRQKKLFHLQYQVDLNDCNVQDDDQATFELTVALVSFVVGEYFKVNQVPMKLIYQGRKYHDVSFFDTLGLFVDILPLLIHTDRDKDTLIQGINEKINLLNRYNVNFMNMVVNLANILKWRDVVSLTTPKKLAQKDPMLLLNYAGKSGKDYRKIIDFATSQMLSDPTKLDYASFYVIATSDDDHLILDFLCNFEPQMEKFKTLLDKHLDILTQPATVQEQQAVEPSKTNLEPHLQVTED